MKNIKRMLFYTQIIIYFLLSLEFVKTCLIPRATVKVVVLVVFYHYTNNSFQGVSTQTLCSSTLYAAYP